MTNNYYQKHKERLWKEARERYQNLSEEKKDKRRKNTREKYQNPTNEEKEKRCKKNFSGKKMQNLVEYTQNH